MSGDIMNFGDDGITRLQEGWIRDRRLLESQADEIAEDIEAQHDYKVPGVDEKPPALNAPQGPPFLQKAREEYLRDLEEIEAKGLPLKYDTGKPRLSLLFSHLQDAMASMAQVLEYGAEKYPSIDNFQGHGDKIPEMYLSAAMRHLAARAQGEVKDPESGLDHLGHAMVSLAFVAWWDGQND